MVPDEAVSASVNVAAAILSPKSWTKASAQVKVAASVAMSLW